MNNNDKFKMNIVGCDRVIDEKANSFIAMRQCYWGVNEDNVKLDIRKYYTNGNGEEVMGKGISFLTEEGPNELTKVLIEEGYGRTDDVLQAVSTRPDFRHCLNSVLSPSDEHYDATVESNEQIYIPTDTMFDYDEE